MDRRLSGIFVNRIFFPILDKILWWLSWKRRYLSWDVVGRQNCFRYSAFLLLCIRLRASFLVSRFYRKLAIRIHQDLQDYPDRTPPEDLHYIFGCFFSSCLISDIPEFVRRRQLYRSGFLRCGEKRLLPCGLAPVH